MANSKSTFGISNWEIGKLYIFTYCPTIGVRDYRSWTYGAHSPKIFSKSDNKMMSAWIKQAEHAHETGNLPVRHLFKTKDCFVLLGHGSMTFGMRSRNDRESIEFIRVLVQGKDCMLGSLRPGDQSFTERGFRIERYNG